MHDSLKQVFSPSKLRNFNAVELAKIRTTKKRKKRVRIVTNSPTKKIETEIKCVDNVPDNKDW